MASRASRPLRVVIAVVAVVVALGAGWWVSKAEPDRRDGLAQALDLVPGDAVDVSYVDWADVRAEAGDDDVLAAVRRSDLASRSSLAPVTDAVDAALGLGVGRVRWEATILLASGTVWALGLPGGSVTDRLADAGYVRDGGIWSIDAQARSSSGLKDVPRLAHVAVVAERGVLVAAAERGALEEVLAAAGGSTSWSARPDVARFADGLRGADAVVMQPRDAGCAVADAGSRGPEALAQLRAALGDDELVSYAMVARAIDDDGGEGQRATVAMLFDSPSVAADQARVRERLATGPAIGTSGAVEDLLRLTGATSAGPVTTLRFDRDRDAASLLGMAIPLAFAACTT